MSTTEDDLNDKGSYICILQDGLIYSIGLILFFLHFLRKKIYIESNCNLRSTRINLKLSISNIENMSLEKGQVLVIYTLDRK